MESKHFEDLEFQQLEHESRLDEEKENLTQQLLREVAEYQRNIVTRKVLPSGVIQCKNHNTPLTVLAIITNIAIAYVHLPVYVSHLADYGACHLYAKWCFQLANVHGPVSVT